MYEIKSTNDKKLKPCSCGCEAEVKSRPLMYWVECLGCGFSKRYFINEESAIKAWNE